MGRFVTVCASLVVVVLGGFAIYSFVWKDGGGHTHGFPSASITKHGRVYTLHEGDFVRVPAAATVCQASAEGGLSNLFCERSPEGRYEVVFYKDSFLVWTGPENAIPYHWQTTKN